MKVTAIGAGDMDDSPYTPNDPRNYNNPEGIAQTNNTQAQNNSEVLDALASHIKNQWEINKRDRTTIEREMLLAQMAVNNRYDSQTLSAIQRMGGSEIYIPLTSMQVNAGVSWLLSVINPAGDKAFSIKKSPVSQLPKAIELSIASEVTKNIAQGAPKNPQGQTLGPDNKPVTEATVNQTITNQTDIALEDVNREATKRAEKMENLIADQLHQSGWFKTIEDFVNDLAVFPSAFIKTTYEYQTNMVVTKGEDGKISMESEEVLVEKDERVSPFDIYPSPDQTCMDNGSMIERLKLSHDSIYQCIGIPGYSEENILKVLKENPGGTTDFQSAVDSERRRHESHTTSFSGDDGSLYGLRFTGAVSMDKLVNWGYPVESLEGYGLLTEPLVDGELSDRDAMKPIKIDAIFVGNHVIKAVPNLDPQGKRPYYMASYRKVPGSFWGKSIAMLASQHQRMVNATARALSNNMGIASGPLIWVNVDRLPSGEAINAITPLSVYQGTSDPTGNGNSKPIEFFQAQSNANELLGVYNSFFDSVGDVTGIPKAAYMTDPSKQSPAANTAAGMAMLLETASKQIKQAVRNIDTGVIEERLKQQYKMNMRDPEIPNEYKGDFQIVATGAQSIVSKAVQNQRSIELLQTTANPQDAKILGPEGRAKLIKTILREYDMMDIVPSDRELKKVAEMESQKQKAPSPEEVKLQIENIRAETRLKDQEMENYNAAEERKTRLAIANLEHDAKLKSIEAGYAQNESSNETRIRQTIVKEKSNNARQDAEMLLKQQMGTGI